MKKVLLVTAILAGSLVLTNAQAATYSQPTNIEQVAQEDVYKEVALADLNEQVQAAVKTLAGEAFEVTKVEFCAEKELTKVTLVNKEDKTEKVTILDKEGKEVK